MTLRHALPARGSAVRRWGPRPIAAPASTAQHAQYELRICTNRTCKRQGSPAILKFAKDLALDELEVAECGCLGNCGAGPNAVLLPQGLVVRHVATPAALVQLLSSLCQLQVSQELLKATELRLAGNAHAMSGELQRAVELYTQGLELGLERGRHLLLANRSAAHLQLGNKQEALQDAQGAAQGAPASFHTAWVRLIDARYALGQYREAAEALADAQASCPSFGSIPEFKAIHAAVCKAAGQSLNAAA